MAYETKIALGVILAYGGCAYATALWFGYENSKYRRFPLDGWEILIVSLLWIFTVPALIVQASADTLGEWSNSHSVVKYRIADALFILTLPFRPAKIGELVGNWIRSRREKEKHPLTQE